MTALFALHFSPLSIPLECKASGFNKFMNHTLGNTTNLQCLHTYQWEALDIAYNCSALAFCAPPPDIGLMTNDYNDENRTFPLVEQDNIIK